MFQNVAVLVDGDNVSCTAIPDILAKISELGHIALRRVYGNWSKETNGHWEATIKKYAFLPVQQYAYVAGKNATDIMLVIDCINLLGKGIYDAFAIVSSDSDFTPLIIHLKESRAYTIGVGEKKTPDAFRNSCDCFLEFCVKESELPAPKPKQPQSDMERIHEILRTAARENRDAEGYTTLSCAGSCLRQADSAFSPKKYGFSSLTALMQGFPQKYFLKDIPTKGKPSTTKYRCLG